MAEPSAMRIARGGELSRRAERLRGMLSPCRVCPRNCGVDRIADELGHCRIGLAVRVSSFGPHFGEESMISGRRGSGTVFFSGCNLHCVFCQNSDISQSRSGAEVTTEELSEVFLSVQAMRCHNLNLVSPSHVVPQIVAALVLAIERGFRLPIVYNSGGYDSVETLKLVDGVVDVYMPDLKYADAANGSRYSDAPEYPEVAKAALREMHGQVGDMVVEDGVAVRGLLVRHLVLPGELSGSAECFRFLAAEVSPGTHVNVMDQYHPWHMSCDFPELCRRPTREEYRSALTAAMATGLVVVD